MCYSNSKFITQYVRVIMLWVGRGGCWRFSYLHAYLQNQIFKYQNRLEGIKLFPLLFFVCICFLLFLCPPFLAAWCVEPLVPFLPVPSLCLLALPLVLWSMFHTIQQHSLTKTENDKKVQSRV